MAIDLIPAMTGAEIRGNMSLPPKIAWLSCHFSPWNTGLSNLPDRLPEGSVLILDDANPFRGHDTERITTQLRETVARCKCEALLLDFQHPGIDGESALAEALIHALPCPVGVSASYASTLPCPVFLPPVPPDIPPEEYLQTWQNREIWLDVAAEGTQITLTEAGSAAAPQPVWELPDGIVHAEEALFCHYTVDVAPDAARFFLYRTGQDLEKLIARACDLGVTKCFTLWQEWAYG